MPFTPIVPSDNVDAPTMNAVLTELDESISDVLDGTTTQTSPDIADYTNAQHDHTDATNGGKIPPTAIDNTGSPSVGDTLIWDGTAYVPGIPAAAAFDVGDIKMHFGAALTGWILCSGRTIGNAASGATGRANADTETLFTHLWDESTNDELVIQDSSGTPTTRGASAADDFAASKRLPLPDLRDRFPLGKGDMGGTAASRVTAAESDDLGGSGGGETHTLANANLPAGTYLPVSANSGYSTASTALGANANYAFGNNTTTKTGTATPVNHMNPWLAINFFIKL